MCVAYKELFWHIFTHTNERTHVPIEPAAMQSEAVVSHTYRTLICRLVSRTYRTFLTHVCHPHAHTHTNPHTHPHTYTLVTWARGHAISGGGQPWPMLIWHLFLDHWLQPIAFGVSFNLNLQSPSRGSLCHGTYQKTPRKLDYRFKSETAEGTLQTQ